MAATARGARLTTEYRARQLAEQAGTIRELIALWDAVDVTNLSDTIDVFARAAALLVESGFDSSAAAAAAYVSDFRAAELGRGIEPRIASRPRRSFIMGQLRGAGLRGILDARRAGKGVDYAGQQGLIRTIGTLGRLVLGGGRQTITSTIAADPVAIGWMRATSGDPCPFCRMLASRGATYKTERSATFTPHDHCLCTPEPLYIETDTARGPVAQGGQYATEFATAQRWARSNGTMSAGTSNNALNNYRRWVAAGSPEVG